jgi:RNA polymerase sigma-70 factor (ECF subfamily)
MNDPLHDIVRRCRDGDRGAWVELYRACGPTIRRFVCCIAGPTADSDDLVQEIFVEVAAGLERFRGDSRFTTWLYGIAIHVTRDHLRTESRRRRRHEAFGAWKAAEPEMRPDTLDQAAALERLRRVWGALEGLGTKTRAAWMMCDVEGLSPAEAAAALDVPVVTVRVRLFRARRALLATLELADGPQIPMSGAYLARSAGTTEVP